MFHGFAPQTSLPERAASAIRDAINSGRYRNDGRLPAEPELCAQFRVSRGTIRHAISILEEEGLVVRRHGSGTYVTGQALGLRNNLSVNFGVTDLIESAGWHAGSRSASIALESADKRTREALHLDDEAQVVVLRRTRTADDRPVARTTDIVGARVLRERGIEDGRIAEFVEQHQSLYRALADLGIPVKDGVAELTPAKANRALAAELLVPVGSLLLCLDQVDFALNGEPLLVSQEFFVADAFRFQVYRKGQGAR